MHSIRTAIYGEPVFASAIATIDALSEHMTYEQMAEKGFSPKKRRKDPWDQTEIQALLSAVKEIASGRLQIQVKITYTSSFVT
jgi:hypothetical protein